MSVTLTAKINETKRLLDQSGNSSLGTITDGAGNVLFSNDAVITDAINMGRAELARSCFPLFTTGTLAVTTAGLRSFRLHQFTVPTGQGRLWAAMNVSWGIAGGSLVGLQEILKSDYLNRKPDYMFKANAEPTVWFDDGTKASISIDPAPSLTTKTLYVYGLCLPPILGDGTGGTLLTDDFLPDDEAIRLEPAAAAIYLAKKNYDNEEVYGRLGHLIPDYDERRMRWYELIEKGVFRNKYYPTPPALFAPSKK